MLLLSQYASLGVIKMRAEKIKSNIYLKMTNYRTVTNTIGSYHSQSEFNVFLIKFILGCYTSRNLVSSQRYILYGGGAGEGVS